MHYFVLSAHCAPPAWFAPAPPPSLERMREAVSLRAGDARRRANARRGAGRQATAIRTDLAEAQRRMLLSREAERQSTEIRSAVKVVHSMRTPSPNHDLQLLRSLAAAEALESPRSPSPSVDNGSVKSGQEGPASISHSARTLSPTAWSARAGVSLRARRNSRQQPDATSGCNYSKDIEPECWD